MPDKMQLPDYYTDKNTYTLLELIDMVNCKSNFPGPILVVGVLDGEPVIVGEFYDYKKAVRMAQCAELIYEEVMIKGI
jgi:hypothetical protein